MRSRLFDDPEALAKPIVTVLHDTKRSAEMAALGIERAKDYTWDRVVKRYVGVYESVLGRSIG